MPELTLWKNQEISKLKRDMDRLFSRLWDDFSMPGPAGAGTLYERPLIDLSEKGDHLELKAEIPGVDPKDLEVSIADDLLIIKGKTENKTVRNKNNVQRVERRVGSFSRSIRLPCRINIDAVRASYNNGILRMEMPKCQPEAEKKIEINYR